MTKELIDVLELRKAKVSLAELERVNAELIASLTDLRIRFQLELDMLENNIKLNIGEEDRPIFDQAVRSGSLQIPDYVSVKTIPQLGKIKPSLGDHFPQAINVPNAYYDIPSLKGKLILENGCIRLHALNDYFGENSLLLIWDPRFSTRTQDGIVQVIDSNTGEVLASVGDYIEMGNNGEFINALEFINELRAPIPEECTGLYQRVGQFIKRIDYP
jgi:hypothetical protein